MCENFKGEIHHTERKHVSSKHQWKTAMLNEKKSEQPCEGGSEWLSNSAWHHRMGFFY